MDLVEKILEMVTVEKIPEIDPVEAVEKILKYSFSNKSLLKDALTRTGREKLQTARLQFLGEAALALAFTNHVFLAYPTCEPSELTELRCANLNIDKFNRAAVNHGLYQFLIGNVDPGTTKKVKDFTEAVSKEDDPGPYGITRSGPTILCDIVESVAGAVYIDVNFDVRRLWEICRGLFEPIYTLDDLRRQPQLIATLFRLAEKHGKRIEFRHCKGAGGLFKAEVYLDDTFIAGGTPKKSGNQAKLAAAKAALSILSESMPIEMVMDEDRLDIDIEDAKEKLIEICNKRKWPNPIYRLEKRVNREFVCSATIETPTEEGTIYIKGDRKKRRTTAEDSSASLMIRALKFSLKDDL